MRAGAGRDDPGHVEHVGDDLDLRPRAPLDDVDGMVAHRLVVGMEPEELDPAEHGVERGPKLMRQGRQEVVLDPRRPPGLVREPLGFALQRRDSGIRRRQPPARFGRRTHCNEGEEDLAEARDADHAPEDDAATVVPAIVATPTAR
jgi:hypothetical protein